MQISVMADVHGTLACATLRIYGSEDIKRKWLPDLATSKVSSLSSRNHAEF